MERPVFYDPSGRRRRWSKRVLWALLVILTLAALGFGATIVNVPAPDPLKIGFEREQPRALGGQIAHLRRAVGRNVRKLTAWMPGGPVAARPEGRQLVAAFYVPWDDASRATLHAHANEIDWVVAAMGFVTGPKHDLTYEPNALANRNLRAELNIAQRKPRLMVMIQNAQGGDWDGKNLALLLRDPKARAHLLDQVEKILDAEGARGVTFDFEELPPKAQPYYQRFIDEAHKRFAPKNKLVTLAVPVEDDDWNLKTYAKLADRVFLMVYDEHSNESEPGPIASQPWFVQRLRATLAQVGPDKAIVAFGNYAYDWQEGAASAESITVEDAWLTAHDSGAKTRFDAASGNATYDYKDDDGDIHHVWMLDAASSWNQLRAAKAFGVFGVALWRMGGDDPGTWDALSALRAGNQPPRFGKIDTLSNTNVEGFGEIIRIDTTPTEGFRTVTRDVHGLIRDEQYQSYPTPYVVNRTGMSKTKVALTFDDGPDATWTPQILDILEAKHVPATFFVVGENALAHPLLLKRILDGGSEIGNHSYTHPNMALVSQRGQQIELNTTQRLVQAYTGRSMRFFRAPYFGDAEPTTTDELEPILFAQKAGYISVGLHADSEDWTMPGVKAIVDNTINAVVNGRQAIEDEDYQHSANVVLMHDSGGNRAQTVAALPMIIDGLRARGFELVPVSALAGLTPAQVNHPISSSDLVAVRFDIGIFLVLAGVNALLKYMFFTAIFLGMARAVLLAILAVRSNLKHNRPIPPEIDPGRFVSVLIPAFNEARVIETSVRRVLASTDIQIEVIVIDDGSKDETSAIVAAAFADDPRVRLLTLENGGKARALNKGLELAKGEVIVALDADTQFEPETIARLSRWFADPEVGA